MAVEKIQFAMPMAAEPEEPSLVVKAGPRGAGMPEPGEVDYSSDEEFDSDEDPEVSYAKICERRTRETLAALPWLTFESDVSILKRQEYQELKRQQQEEQVYVAV